MPESGSDERNTSPAGPRSSTATSPSGCPSPSSVRATPSANSERAPSESVQTSDADRASRRRRRAPRRRRPCAPCRCVARARDESVEHGRRDRVARHARRHRFDLPGAVGELDFVAEAPRAGGFRLRRDERGRSPGERDPAERVRIERTRRISLQHDGVERRAETALAELPAAQRGVDEHDGQIGRRDERNGVVEGSCVGATRRAVRRLGDGRREHAFADEAEIVEAQARRRQQQAALLRAGARSRTAARWRGRAVARAAWSRPTRIRARARAAVTGQESQQLVGPSRTKRAPRSGRARRDP